MSKQLVLDAAFTAGFIDTAPVYKKVKGGYIQVKDSSLSKLKRANLKRLAQKPSQLSIWVHRLISGLYKAFRGFAYINILLLQSIDLFFRWVTKKDKVR